MSDASKKRFWARLRQLGYSSYEDYLASQHWADVRQRFFASKLYKGRCYACREVRDIQLHHRTYARIGDEHLGDLVALCRDCHRQVHDREDALGQPLRRATKRVIHQTWAKLSRDRSYAGGRKRAQGRRPPMKGG